MSVGYDDVVPDRTSQLFKSVLEHPELTYVLCRNHFKVYKFNGEKLGCKLGMARWCPTMHLGRPKVLWTTNIHY